jgi:hypothetical protein
VSFKEATLLVGPSRLHASCPRHLARMDEALVLVAVSKHGRRSLGLICRCTVPLPSNMAAHHWKTEPRSVVSASNESARCLKSDITLKRKVSSLQPRSNETQCSPRVIRSISVTKHIMLQTAHNSERRGEECLWHPSSASPIPFYVK